MWREDPFTMRGRYWTVEPPVSVIPKPIQKPHPPIWVAATNPDTFVLAAERGLGVLCFTLGVELGEVRRRIELYREGIRGARPVGLAINNQVSMNIMGLCGEDARETEQITRDAVLWYVRKGNERQFQHLRVVIQRGKELGVFDPELDVNWAATQIWSSTVGVQLLWYLHGPRFDLRRSVRRQAREFLRQWSECQ
jgi:alkanesulfonate monooxygenase SsuD/methylene tetrahydromethanopterin reductase-like flavin-dependent oxidoreductase (luciferase family)